MNKEENLVSSAGERNWPTIAEHNSRTKKELMYLSKLI